MTWIIARLIAGGVPERLAKPVLIAALVALAFAGFGIAKCSYDRSIIAKHDAAANAKAAARNDAAKDAASTERRADDQRISEAQKGYDDAISKAPAGAPGPATVALGCERLRRQGTRAADLPAACRSDR